MYREQNRAFSYAVLASIVLHGMALFGLPHRSPALPPIEPQLPILIARIAEPPAPARDPVFVPPVVKPPPPVQRQKPKPRPRTVEKPDPTPQPKAEPAPPVAEAAPAAPPPVIARAEDAPRAAAPAPPAAAPAPVQPEPPMEPALDPRSIAEYRLQIIGAAPRYKRYPPLARENNWEGLVALRMEFGSNGRLAALAVTRTSGYDVLDKQAAEMFRNAAQAVPVPALLRGKEFSVEVAAIYGLRD
jgi:protein TonB